MKFLGHHNDGVTPKFEHCRQLEDSRGVLVRFDPKRKGEHLHASTLTTALSVVRY